MARRCCGIEVREDPESFMIFALVVIIGLPPILIFCFSDITYQYMSRDPPTIYLNDIHVSSLNKTSHLSSSTTRIYFDLTIHNNNLNVGIYYNDPVKLIFTYFPPPITRNTKVIIGEYTIQGFYQGNGKTKHVQDFVVVQDLFSEDTHRRDLGESSVSLTGPVKVVVFRVDLDVNIKFKSIENKKLEVLVGSFVEINGDSGDLVQKKITELEYASLPTDDRLLQKLLTYLVFVLLSACYIYVSCTMAGRVLEVLIRSLSAAILE